MVLTGAGDNFCSGGDVHEIIGPLTKMSMLELLAFTRMTGALVSAMRACPQPIVAAIDGVCAGAGAMMALASDLRLGTPNTNTAFLFTRVGLAGADMGACALLPRMIGQGRASELLFTGRAMTAAEGHAWGFFNALHDSAALLPAAHKLAAQLAQGPTFAHGMTKTMLHQEWAMTLDQAIEGRGTGAGHLHADTRFPPRVRSVRRRSSALRSKATEHEATPVRAEPVEAPPVRMARALRQAQGERKWGVREMVAFEHPHGMHPPQAQWELPFFEPHHREMAPRLADWGRAATGGRGRRPRRVPGLGGPPGPGTAGCATACPPRTAARCLRSTRARW